MKRGEIRVAQLCVDDCFNILLTFGRSRGGGRLGLGIVVVSSPCVP